MPGSGPQGRISHQDFDAFVAAGGQLVSREVPKRTAVRETRLTGMRRVIARKMLESKRNIPHYSYVEEVDVTQLEALRKHLNTERNPEQPKLTLLPFLALAMVKVLPKFPHCNARYDSDSEMLSEYEAVHLGIATMTDSGLMVPVVRNCEALDVWQLAAEIARSAGNARDGKAKPDQLSGSTITITSLGAIGGVSTTPVINAPETSIIGVNKMVDRPVVRDGQIVVRTMMNLSASFDHRIVDGYDGAQLVQALRALLENPGAIFV